MSAGTSKRRLQLTLPSDLEIYEGAPDAPGLATVSFSGAGGLTKLAILVRHTSQENRDAHLNSGMEAGANESLDLLEQVAQSLQ